MGCSGFGFRSTRLRNTFPSRTAHFALQMRPDSWDAEYNLGTALLGQGKVDEAIFHCDRAVQPNDPDAQVSLGNAGVAAGYVSQRILAERQQGS
jgi:Tfp pilus assembly protein PilF